MLRYYIETLQGGQWRKFTHGYFDTLEQAENNLRLVKEFAEKYGSSDPDKEARIHEMTEQEIKDNLILLHPNAIKEYVRTLSTALLEEIVEKHYARHKIPK